MSDFNNMVHVNEDTVPNEYQIDPIDVDAEYDFIELTKSDADEKNVSEVYVYCCQKNGAKKTKRVGWILPILALVSSDHDYFDNKYFRKHAFEMFKKYHGNSFDERMHVLVYSKRLEVESGVNVASVLLNLCKYGLYPYKENHAKRENIILLKITKRICLEEGFDLISSKGFINLLFYKLIQVEVNPYARFMFFYQVLELLMEVKFHSKMNIFRKKYSNLHMIRSKIQDYSTEKSLINAIYHDTNLNSCDAALAQILYGFYSYRNEHDHTALNRSELIYDFRNTIVHSYYRFNFNDELDQFTDCIERDIYSILSSMFSIPDLNGEKQDLIEKYFNR